MPTSSVLRTAAQGLPSILVLNKHNVMAVCTYGLTGLTALFLVAWLYQRKMVLEWNQNLALLGSARKAKMRRTAVICGGSIAGMITAQVCANHFEDVVLVDPEISKAETAGAKRRVAQYDSLHAYLTFMVDGLRRIWPNLDEQVERVGGVFRPGDFQLKFGGIPLLAAQSAYRTPQQETSDKRHDGSAFPDTMLIRRPKLEAVLYRLLVSSSNVRLIQGNVTGVVPSKETARLEGVTIRGSEGNETTLSDIELVVDCTGSTQAGLKWLKSAGYLEASEGSKPARISYDHKLRYVTITFEDLGDLVHALPIPGGYDKAGFIYTYYAHYKWGNEGFVLTRMDGDSIQLCCGGWGDVNLPKEKDDIIPYIRSVKGERPPAPWVVKVVERLVDCETTGHGNIIFKPLKIPAPSYVQYHNLAGSLPSNFIAIGDSEMQLNPIFAQGCSKALFGVMTLNSILLHCSSCETGPLPANFSKTYFRSSHRTLEDIWTSTKAIDYGYSTTTPISGESREKEGLLIRWFAYHAARAAEKDAVVASTLWHVRMLASPQIELFNPWIIARVLWAAVLRTIS